MKIRENMLIKFVRTAHGVSRNSIHSYSNKFSRHDFTLYPAPTAFSFVSEGTDEQAL